MKRKLPLIENFELPEGIDFGPRADQVNLWEPGLVVTNLASGDTVIDIYDVIGRDPFFGGGVGSQDVARALKGAGNVQVNVNSPGGLFSEGNAIYNLFVQHPGEVTVNVIGRAASAAALLSMGGDQINIAPSAFMFVHNAQVVAEGDRHDLMAVATDLEQIDEAITNIYAARTGKGKRQVQAWLDESTTFNSADAVKNGFADAILKPGTVQTSNARNELREGKPIRYVDALMAQHGKTRVERREMLNALKSGKPGAAVVQPGADLSGLADDLRTLASKL